MKRISALAISYGFLLVLSCLLPKHLSAQPSSSEDVGQLLEVWGWFAATEKGVDQAELNSVELAAFRRGMVMGCKGEQPSYDLQKISPDVEKMSANRRAKFWRSAEEAQLAAGRTFLSTLVKNTNVIKAPSGFYYEIVKPGTGPFPKPEQTVTVHYVGRLIDGTDFTELGPYDVVLVKNRLLPALFEGIQKINTGGKMMLYVAPITPGTDEVRPGVPRGATTVYEVEILEIKETPPDELANCLLPPAPELAELPASGASDEQISEAWGWFTARQFRATELGLNEDELAAFLRGVIAAMRSEACVNGSPKMRSAVEKWVAGRRVQARQAIQAKRIQEMDTFLAGLKNNSHIVEMPDGLRYEILRAGKGLKPKQGQIVVVDYTGRLVDGTIFDQTYNEPLHIEIGSVIPGLNEGLQQINKGGRIRLFVPPSIGYGDEAVSGVVSRIPANSLLIYEIELIDIKNATQEGGG